MGGISQLVFKNNRTARVGDNSWNIIDKTAAGDVHNTSDS